MADKAPRNEPSVEVKARLMHDVEDDAVVVFIGDSPIAVPQKRMPGTYEKLLKMIEKGRNE
ncbi:MAG: hypothetical protein GEU71_04035 [Actinobacteria bacterium]|nr:hypothetical protein [Actinomycetota bacterium]